MEPEHEMKPEFTDLSNSCVSQKKLLESHENEDFGDYLGMPVKDFLTSTYSLSREDGRGEFLEKTYGSRSSSNPSLAHPSSSHLQKNRISLEEGGVKNEEPTAEYSNCEEQQNRPKFRRWRHKEYQCDDCDRMFTLKHNLQNHYVQYHMGCKTLHKPCISCKCQVCGKIYSAPSILAEHQKEAHELYTKMETCSICYESFVTATALGRHIKQEHVRQSKRCPFEGCEDKVFKYLKDVNEHIRVSHNRKKDEDLVCSICDMAFKRMSTKMKHEEKHMARRLEREWKEDFSDEYVPAFMAGSSTAAVPRPPVARVPRKVGRPPKKRPFPAMTAPHSLNEKKINLTENPHNQPSTSTARNQKVYHPELEAVPIKRKVAKKLSRNDILEKIK